MKERRREKKEKQAVKPARKEYYLYCEEKRQRNDYFYTRTKRDYYYDRLGGRVERTTCSTKININTLLNVVGRKSVI